MLLCYLLLFNGKKAISWMESSITAGIMCTINIAVEVTFYFIYAQTFLVVTGSCFLLHVGKLEEPSKLEGMLIISKNGLNYCYTSFTANVNKDIKLLA